ncbi:MAG: hypothetical protein ACE5GQ_00235 [Nitrospinales bacterium]
MEPIWKLADSACAMPRFGIIPDFSRKMAYEIFPSAWNNPKMLCFRKVNKDNIRYLKTRKFVACNFIESALLIQ